MILHDHAIVLIRFVRTSLSYVEKLSMKREREREKWWQKFGGFNTSSSKSNYIIFTTRVSRFYWFNQDAAIKMDVKNVWNVQRRNVTKETWRRKEKICWNLSRLDLGSRFQSFYRAFSPFLGNISKLLAVRFVPFERSVYTANFSNVMSSICRHAAANSHVVFLWETYFTFSSKNISNFCRVLFNWLI